MFQSALVSKGSAFFWKKRPMVAIAAGLTTLFLFFYFSSFLRPPRQSFQLDDLHGFLYMVSSTDHLLAHDLDVNAPMESSTWAPREAFDHRVWKQRIKRLNEDSPVIVFSKSYCPYSKRAKELLARYALTPAPRIVEVDLRDDSDTIKRLLYRLTGHSTFPNVILRGRSLGGYDDLYELHNAGNLAQEFEKEGVKFTGIVDVYDK